MSREAIFQDKLRDLIMHVSKRFKFDGLEISRVERDFPVDSKKVDIAIFLRGNIPFLFIETKREARERTVRFFDPLSPIVVGQAIGYVYLYREKGYDVPYFATANPNSIAVFRTPANLIEYIKPENVKNRKYDKVFKFGKFTELIENHLIIRERIKLSEEYVQDLFDRLAKDYLEERIIKIEPSYAIIEQFRSFVNDVSSRILDLLKYEIGHNEELKTELEKMAEETGYMPDAESLARMMAYILMNKLIFYKVLEGKYKLPPLIELPTESNTEFKATMEKYFDKAVEVTGDFEPIFITGVYDLIPIPEDPDLMDRINDFITFLNSINVEEVGELAGYIYEELIPPEERHQLGQFYTPPVICELITKWAVRNSDDKVLDPGVGSGGFILQAYRRLLQLKTGRTELPAPSEVHERILKQLYAVDVNPFATHITAMNLSMKNVRSPASFLNIIEHDFFNIMPKTKLFTSYRIRTAAGMEYRREMEIPPFDAVIGNPPYTRWVEIPETTKKAIKERLSTKIKKYHLTPVVTRGFEPGIYVYWIMHATDFLKNGGRLGMIISNLWMQTDYGIEFGKFLLDHYKIKAIIDFTLRLFTALISTCVILLERETKHEERENNEVLFIHLPGQIDTIDVDKILETIEGGGHLEKAYIKKIRQGDIPKDKKWIDIFFGIEKIFESPLLTEAKKYFEISYGNLKYLYLTSTGKIHGVRNPGSSDFTYLSPSKVKKFGLEKYSYPNVPLEKAIIYPAITSSRYAIHFTFTEDDWKKLHKENKNCYMFICHKPIDQLPKEVVEYIRRGEPICPRCGKLLIEEDENFFKCKNGHLTPKTEKFITKLRGSRKGGRFASETESAKTREREREHFYGWYDLGGVINASFFAIYQARYKTRFIKCDFPIAMYHALISFIPKANVSLDDIEIKSLLSYLNSSFTQYYIETHGRYIAKGPIGFEIKHAKEMPVLKLSLIRDDIKMNLAKKFDELEMLSRRLGGVSKRENLEKISEKIREIDYMIGELLNLTPEEIEMIRDMVELLVERRVYETEHYSSDHIRKKTKNKLKQRKLEKIKKLDDFI